MLIDSLIVLCDVFVIAKFLFHTPHAFDAPFGMEKLEWSYPMVKKTLRMYKFENQLKNSDNFFLKNVL